MNKIFKGVVLSLMAVAGLASCSSNDYSYSPADTPANAQVFFPVSNSSSFTLSDDAETINIPIQRGKTDDAVTVNLTVTVAQKASAFTIPSSVSFAAGEATANIAVNYDPTQMEYESKDTITITIGDESYTTPYGSSIQKMFVTLPSPLNLLGTGTFEDTWVWGGKGKVKIYQNKLNPNEFRVVSPFEAVLTAMAEADGKNPADYLAELNGRQSPYINITVMQPGNKLGEVTITQKNLIFYNDINTGYYNTSNDYNQDILALHPSRFTNLATESAWTYNRVVDWQENGLPGRIQIAPYFYMDGIGGWNYTQKDGIITIDFPGYTPKDFTAELAYAGIFTDVNNQVFAVGNLTLGADAEDVKAVVVPGDADASAVADAIAAGDLEAADVVAGRIEVAIPEDMTGKLQLVVVVLDEGTIKNIATANFEYYGGGGNPWKSLGMGYYTEDYIVSYYGEQDGDGNFVPYEPETYQVEIEESNETPGVYRMKNAYAPLCVMFGIAGGEKDIEINAQDPAGVYIPNQLTGFNPGDGEYSIESYGGYLIANNSDVAPSEVIAYFTGRFGTLSSGEITFPTVTSSNGVNFQGYLYKNGELHYYGGTTLASKIVLPTAAASVKAKAKRAAAASDFARRLSGKFHQNKAVKTVKSVAKKCVGKRENIQNVVLN